MTPVPEPSTFVIAGLGPSRIHGLHLPSPQANRRLSVIHNEREFSDAPWVQRVRGVFFRVPGRVAPRDNSVSVAYAALRHPE